jgi:FAD:protein FMN transferase
VASFLFALLLAGCGTSQEEILFDGATMGTTYSIKYLDNGDVDRESVSLKVEQLLEFIDGAMSTYKEESELNQLNKVAVDEAFPVSSMLWQLLLIAEHVFQVTDGAFDPTVGPLVDLWGFGPIETENVIPAQIEIDSLMTAIGFQHLKFIPASQSVEKLRDIRLDLSAIAKGFAAEQVAELLIGMNVNNFLVEIGGELRAAGLNGGGQAWRVAIEVPTLARGGVQQVISMKGVGVATSGDYRNYFEQDGVRYSHTIDPRTGQPVTHNLASVTVIAQDTTEADALATAYMVLGSKAALAMANRDNVAALFLTKSVDGFTELNSHAFTEYVRAQ